MGGFLRVVGVIMVIGFVAMNPMLAVDLVIGFLDGLLYFVSRLGELGQPAGGVG